MAGAGLAASGGLLPFLLSLALVAGFNFLSSRDPMRALKAVPCGETLRTLVNGREIDCLTDNVSYGGYRGRNTLVVGGKFVKEFPRWREVVECLLRVPYSETPQKILGYSSSFLMVAVGFVLPPGLFAIAVLYALAFVMMMGVAAYLVRRTKKHIPEDCKEVMKEYAEFYRKKAKERDKRSIVID
ncbi:hypothetical protein A3L08_08795 [Thermococcus pacificus]|uniref:Uncharacterized protein n=2 Tax=Thermococcus pacificus TaxID=71998 RepID=A0A218P9G5_9EURY|nr:hypothetical protein A3L08_08795 [Thermococcus pacificus]